MYNRSILNNFEAFIKEWSSDNEYVLFGASKECVQFIRSMDFLLGEGKLKIKYIVDHEPNSTTADNINEISSYYHQSKSVNNSRKDINVIHIDEFEGNDKVIVTTDEFRADYISFLNQRNIEWTLYKNIAAIWPYVYESKVHIFQTDIMVTERCNLNCSFCNMFIPHYESPKHKSLETIISDVDSYFKIVDYVSIFHLVGGEPFLHPQMYDIIKYILDNYQSKIDKFIITTNGTALPKDNIIELLKSNDIILSISNYTDKLELLKGKFDRVTKTYKDNRIKHYIRNEIEWNDFGDLRIKKNMSEAELIEHFDNCTAPFRGLDNGKFYYCHLNTSAVLTKLFPLNENDFVEMGSISKEDLLKFDMGNTKLGYVTFCDNCNGCNTQIKVPVSYEHQGIRKYESNN